MTTPEYDPTRELEDMAARVGELERTPSPVIIKTGETVRVKGWFNQSAKAEDE